MVDHEHTAITVLILVVLVLVIITVKNMGLSRDNYTRTTDCLLFGSQCRVCR
jgi:hypothetical protein